MRFRGQVLAMASAAAAAAFAFDSDAWRRHADEMTADAMRLRAAYSNFCAMATMPADDVRIPLETHPNGNVKTLIVAKKAQAFAAEGLVWAEDVKVEQFKDDGTLDVRLEAKDCLVDRNRRTFWAEGWARAEHGKTVLVGNDAYFSSSNSFIKVFRDTRIVSEDVQLKGLKL